MSKIVLAVGIVVFWLCFTFGSMFINPSKNTIITEFAEESKQIQEPQLTEDNNSITSITTFLKNVLLMIKMFFTGLIFFFESMFFIMPDIPIFLSIIVWIMQFLSLILIVFLIRG